jgi:hypothetical protein
MIDLEEIAMSKPSDGKAPAGESKKAAGVDRRRFFLMGGSAVAAVATVPLASGEAVADNESRAERVKARYRQTDHVNNYYRVNRY